MKKNTMMRIAAVVLMCALITACFASSTFARYTSEATGTDTVTVAKWDVKVDENAFADNMTFNIFDTTSRTDVKNGKIAPGTGGSFALKITNASEVPAQFDVKFEETANASNVPILYCLTANGTYTDDLSTIVKTEKLHAEDKTGKNVTVYWKWDYQNINDANKTGQTDATDTALGTATTLPTVTVKATITAIQLDEDFTD